MEAARKLMIFALRLAGLDLEDADALLQNPESLTRLVNGQQQPYRAIQELLMGKPKLGIKGNPVIGEKARSGFVWRILGNFFEMRGSGKLSDEDLENLRKIPPKK